MSGSGSGCQSFSTGQSAVLSMDLDCSFISTQKARNADTNSSWFVGGSFDGGSSSDGGGCDGGM